MVVEEKSEGRQREGNGDYASASASKRRHQWFGVSMVIGSVLAPFRSLEVRGLLPAGRLARKLAARRWIEGKYEASGRPPPSAATSKTSLLSAPYILEISEAHSLLASPPLAASVSESPR